MNQSINFRIRLDFFAEDFAKILAVLERSQF